MVITKKSIQVGDKVARLMLMYRHGQYEVLISSRGEIENIFEKYEASFKKVMKKYFFIGSKRELYFNDLFGYSARVLLVSEDSIDQYTDPNSWSLCAKEHAVAAC